MKLPTAYEVSLATKVLNPIWKPYAAMLQEGMLPPKLICGYIAEHIQNIQASNASDDVKDSAISELAAFSAENLDFHLLDDEDDDELSEAARTTWSSKVFSGKMPSTYVVHQNGKFAGHVRGKHLKSAMTEKGFHGWLTKTMRMPTAHAHRFIAQVKLGNPRGSHGSFKSYEHIKIAKQHGTRHGLPC